MVGQVILSMPGYACMQCLGFLNEMVLKEEARKYGDAGEQPQVIWANGVLASTAVGILVNILCKWSNNAQNVFYLSYDGNLHTITDHPRLEKNGKILCAHYRIEKTGPIV
jgi:molybdopterin-synthase adenylyltransferase